MNQVKLGTKLCIPPVVKVNVKHLDVRSVFTEAVRIVMRVRNMNLDSWIEQSIMNPNKKERYCMNKAAKYQPITHVQRIGLGGLGKGALTELNYDDLSEKVLGKVIPFTKLNYVEALNMMKGMNALRFDKSKEVEPFKPMMSDDEREEMMSSPSAEELEWFDEVTSLYKTKEDDTTMEVLNLSLIKSELNRGILFNLLDVLVERSGT